jgi:hypothetical protein
LDTWNVSYFLDESDGRHPLAWSSPYVSGERANTEATLCKMNRYRYWTQTPESINSQMRLNMLKIHVIRQQLEIDRLLKLVRDRWNGWKTWLKKRLIHVKKVLVPVLAAIVLEYDAADTDEVRKEWMKKWTRTHFDKYMSIGSGLHF